MTTEPLTTWVVDQTELLLDARIFTVERRSEHSVDGTKRGQFYVLDSKDWVNIIPVTTDNQIVMVEQFRHGTREVSLETPGGLVDGDEELLVTAARELREETGYTGRMRFLGSVAANPAFLTNTFSAVVADDAQLTDPTAFDEHEDLHIRLVPVAELPELLRSGAIRNAYAALALSWYLLGYGPQP